MAVRFIQYDDALRSRNPHAVWSRAKARLNPEVWPALKPGFQFEPGATIFTIGSCFARNVEDHLRRLGYVIPTLDLVVPETEWGGRRANGILNKFTPPSIAQEIGWAAELLRRGVEAPDAADCEKFAYPLDDGSVIDNNLAGFRPVARERFLQRRCDVYRIFRSAFTAACVIITPGMAEAWYDRERGIYIQEVPKFRAPAITSRLQFVLLDFEACFKSLDETIGIIRAFNPDCKILVTTSPVPLERTFTGDDVIVANSYAKSTLRSACGEVSMKWDRADYFPSFENVAQTRSWGIFEEDLIHVSEAFVAKIVASLTAAYCAGFGEAERLYRRSLDETDITAAIVHARDAVALDGDAVDYRAHLGGLLANAELYGEAIVQFRRAHELESTRARPVNYLVQIADIVASKGKLRLACDVLVEAIALDPAVAKLHRRLGVVYGQMGDLEAADAALRTAVKLDPLERANFRALGAVLNRLGRHREAIELMSPWLREGSAAFVLLMQLGIAHQATGDLEEAEEMFRRALGLDPENERAGKRLAKVVSLQRARAGG